MISVQCHSIVLDHIFIPNSLRARRCALVKRFNSGENKPLFRHLLPDNGVRAIFCRRDSTVVGHSSQLREFAPALVSCGSINGVVSGLSDSDHIVRVWDDRYDPVDAILRVAKIQSYVLEIVPEGHWLCID